MLESVDDLFLDFLKDIYFAEKKILRTMPKLVKGAASSELKDALSLHRQETEDKSNAYNRYSNSSGSRRGQKRVKP